jgi:hypothetical protein
VAWHTEVEEEKGKKGGGGWLSARGRREKGGPAAGEGGGRSGIYHAKQGRGWRSWAMRGGMGRPGKRRELGWAREKQC